ncbi:nitrate- and nitrite sensing domain-containing protein [Streptomyces sp. NPDC020983]|uniref:nitrate- and nitrite sensing domain-containing protein n=1 Tax=Streptomyces sp. NPDC020983 TaxID=3365106 RepID=UPI0037B34115
MRERRVRQRMLAALLVCAGAVLAAAAPGVALGAGDLTSAQDQAEQARLAQRTTVLAQDLGDERDDVAALVAAGRGGAVPAQDGTRTDRQVQDVLAAGAGGELRAALGTLPGVRRTALGARAGGTGVQAVVKAYQPLLDALARETAGPAGAALSRVADAASLQRGLLVGALTADGGQPELVAAAQAARLQERAGIADFRATADGALRERYDSTVTGPDAARAEADTTALLGSAELGGSGPGAERVRADLTARLALIRGVEASAATDRAAAAAARRNHTVTVLELRIALAAGCLLLLAGVLVALFRSLTRPLAALHVWARSDAASGRGVQVVGQDEFAAVARRANALTHEAQALRARTADLGNELTAQRGATQSTRGALAGAVAEKDALRRAHDEMVAHVADLERELQTAAARDAAHMSHVSLSLRTLGLVERQLALIETMEEQEQDPDRLGTLFQLDHLATRMRRNSETLLVLGGTEHSHGATASPVPLVDVVRGAISEIERYERVRIQVLPGARVAGRAADDVAHLIAELLDNATGFSAPETEVLLSGRLLEAGEVAVVVEDAGIGVPAERLAELNALLADPDPAPPGAVAGMGLYVVSRLARRHGVQVRLHALPSGGTRAVVLLPGLLIPPVGPDDAPFVPLETAVTGLRGADARRHPSPEPLPYAAQGPHVPERAPQSGGPFSAVPAPRVPVPGQAPHPDRPSTAPYTTPETPAGHPVTPTPAHGTPSVPSPAARVAPLPAAPGHARAAGPAAPITGPQGLPQRVPRGAGGAVRPVAVPPAAPVDADELRRRLAGLQRGLRAGRADAVREADAVRGRDRAPGPQGPQWPTDTAGSVEEATR